ncbi:uncharacterized protein LOC135372164 [Ornithodoros turicata]|uniref:uncharacterized protein LOC135372164 n=1 Tax=Ornithodoros turicata TaxID=34597 RepID=UPI003138E8E8
MAFAQGSRPRRRSTFEASGAGDQDEGWQVRMELSLLLADGTMRPDLIVEKEGMARILHAQVVAHQHKVHKKYTRDDLFLQVAGATDRDETPGSVTMYKEIWPKGSAEAL